MIVVYKTPSFCFVDRQVIAELLSIYENLNGTCETIVMIKGEYFTSNCNWNYAHIIIADRFKIQPYIYVPSLDILLRTKDSVTYRHENGKPDAVGCLLLCFMLRHNLRQTSRFHVIL